MSYQCFHFPRWFVPDLILVPHSECPCGAGPRGHAGSERCGEAPRPRLPPHSTDEFQRVPGYWWIHKGRGKHVSARFWISSPSSELLSAQTFILFSSACSCRWPRSTQTLWWVLSVAPRLARGQSSSTWPRGCRWRQEVHETCVCPSFACGRLVFQDMF